MNFLIERRTPDSGLEAAKRLLRLMHEHTGSANKVAKVPAEKLNEMGIAAAAERLAGKDLIVTEAGDLTEASVNGIVMLIQREPESRVIAMIDNPIQLKKMLTKYPELLQLFHLDKEESTAPSRAQKMTEPVGGNTQPLPDVSPAQQPAYQAVSEPAYQSSSEPVYQPAPQQEMPPVVTPQPEYRSSSEPAYRPASQSEYSPERQDYGTSQQDYQGYPEQSAPGNPPAGGEVPYVSNVQRREKGADEMGVDEFVQVASEYAKDIDCAISGKSMLALYERAEIMEEDGIPLTKENAIALIEEAADRAEKPPIGKKLAGLFTPKYDKEDRLILREEHFVP